MQRIIDLLRETERYLIAAEKEPNREERKKLENAAETCLKLAQQLEDESD